MPSFKRNTKIFSAVAILLVIGAAALLYGRFGARGAGYSFFQTDWSGGATTSAATHADNQTGWTGYYSKDDAIMASTSGQLSLASTTATWTDTTDADFASAVKTNLYSVSDSLSLLKPLGVACSADAECSSGACLSGFCHACAPFTYGSQTYQTVLINTQCWMASNLNIGNYVASTDTGLSHTELSNNSIFEKFCYSNNTSNCNTYGGLYSWNEAMDYVTTNGARGICPEGWHIPTDAEWYALENYLKDDGQSCVSSRSSYGCATAGTKLKQGGSSGFSSPLAGGRTATGAFAGLGADAYFWSSSVGGSFSFFRRLNTAQSGVLRDATPRYGGFSIRCLKDDVY